jgi:hypothetical protein
MRIILEIDIYMAGNENRKCKNLKMSEKLNFQI